MLGSLQSGRLRRGAEIDEGGEEPLRQVELARDEDPVNWGGGGFEFLEGVSAEVGEAPFGGETQDGGPFLGGVDVAFAERPVEDISRLREVTDGAGATYLGYI